MRGFTPGGGPGYDIGGYSGNPPPRLDYGMRGGDDMPRGRWGTVREAAQHYGVSRQSVHKTIRRGGFVGAKIVEMPAGPVWMLPWPFKRRQLRNGRPPKRPT